MAKKYSAAARVAGAVLAVLDGLADEYREERYRAAPLLRRLVLEGRLGRQVGAGFAEHPG